MVNMINITTGGIGISSENPRGLIKMIVDIIKHTLQERDSFLHT